MALRTAGGVPLDFRELERSSPWVISQPERLMEEVALKFTTQVI